MLDWEFEHKIHYADLLLMKSINKGRHVVSFSGGKSSLVALHLALKVCSKTPVVFNNTGVMLPGIPQFVRRLSKKWDFELIETRPGRTFWDVKEEYGYPGNRTSDQGKPRCCYYLKEKPLSEAVKEHGWKILITGMQATESMQRRLWFMKRGGKYKMEKNMPYPVTKVNPLSIWTDEDVWHYIHEKDLPYWRGYDEYDIERTGCLPCTAHIGWEEKMHAISPKLYAKVKREKDQQEVLDNCM